MKYICAVAVILSLLLCSCSDDFSYYNGEIPEGEGDLSATVTFTPASATSLSATRTSGDAIKDINSLCVLVYTNEENGKLVRKYVHTDGNDGQNDFVDWDSSEYHKVTSDDHLDGTDAKPDEDYTPQVSFKIPGLPYGRYKIYAVANMEDMADYTDDIQTEEGLRNIKLQWDDREIGNNDQMFGYFTDIDKMSAKGFDAPTLLFTPDNSQFHAWINRVVSKVTVAFDASGLNQDVMIYVKSVTVYDIPKTCLLGNSNTPHDGSELLNRPIKPYPTPDQPSIKPNDLVEYTRFEYNSYGIIKDSNEHTGNGVTDGYELVNSLRTPKPDGAHDSGAASLFFFENNQGDFEGKTEYDKLQQPSGEVDGVGKPIRDDIEKDENGKEIKTDFKDKVPYGTYVEVYAYYVSQNPGKVGQGYIKYRFMLGKNITYNYDAQRNYHFKLTLGFKGWANQPDWHIDYEQVPPGIEVQPEFRVSYLYNQSSFLPIRILESPGVKIENIKVEIVENNWAPYDPDATNKWGIPDSDENSADIYAFKWNKKAFESAPYMIGNEQVPYYGFLALHLPPDSRKSEVISTGFSLASNIALEAYYKTMKEGERFFGENDLQIDGDYSNLGDDSYEVKPVLDESSGERIQFQRTLMMPVWTRAKTFISESGFSGNNPYEGYERKAKLKITPTFKRTADGSTFATEPEYVDVFQVKRLVNPKGVWRAADRSEAFHVTLLEAESGNQMADFKAFKSEGEWKAFIDEDTNKGVGFYISPNGETEGYQDEEGAIHGYTGSEIHFDINFDRVTVGENAKCAVVKVLYHGNQCMHKIMVRKGYDQPVEVNGTTWSSFSLYQATLKEGTGNEAVYDAVLTKNPLMLGSMFRRGKLETGIFVTNNMEEEGGVGPFQAPGKYRFIVGKKDNKGEWQRLTWDEIGYRDDVGGSDPTRYPNPSTGHRDWGLGTFYVEDQPYKVPEYEDFVNLTNEAEFGFGVVYGSSATAPAMTAKDAYGLIDPYNEGLFDDPRGMRGVIAYIKSSGDQIFFPMGKYGTGRRNNFIMRGNNAGVLRYGDVDYLLIIGRGDNLYRPIPYNVMIHSGNIYWIDKFQLNGGPKGTSNCLGWDMNYFNFDFNAYTDNNRWDALPIKLILVND